MSEQIGMTSEELRLVEEGVKRGVRGVLRTLDLAAEKPPEERLGEVHRWAETVCRELEDATSVARAIRLGEFIEPPVDLKRTDEYEGGIIPNADVEICLRVIRTIRGVCLGGANPRFVDMDGAVVLSHAHAKITELVELAEGDK